MHPDGKLYCSQSKHKYLKALLKTVLLHCVHFLKITAPQHLVCRVVRSLHTNHMQMSIVEVFICRRLHMNTSMIPVCIRLICRLFTALHTKCCGAVNIHLYGFNWCEWARCQLQPWNLNQSRVKSFAHEYYRL